MPTILGSNSPFLPIAFHLILVMFLSCNSYVAFFTFLPLIGGYGFPRVFLGEIFSWFTVIFDI
jgi:hypothetical protein